MGGGGWGGLHSKFGDIFLISFSFPISGLNHNYHNKRTYECKVGPFPDQLLKKMFENPTIWQDCFSTFYTVLSFSIVPVTMATTRGITRNSVSSIKNSKFDWVPKWSIFYQKLGP